MRHAAMGHGSQGHGPRVHNVAVALAALNQKEVGVELWGTVLGDNGMEAVRWCGAQRGAMTVAVTGVTAVTGGGTEPLVRCGGVAQRRSNARRTGAR